MLDDDIKLLTAIVLGAPTGVLVGVCVLLARRPLRRFTLEDRWFHVLCVAYGGLAVLVYLALQVNPNGFVDGYVDRTANLLHTGVYGIGNRATAFYPPGYSFVLYGPMLLFGAGSLAVFAANLSLFYATLYFLRGTLRRFSIRHYNTLCLIVLVSVGRFFFHFIPVSDAIGSYLATGAVLAALTASRHRPLPFAFVSGLLLGLAVLVRPNLIVLLLPIVLVLVIAKPVRLSSTAPGVLLVVIGLALPLSAWTWRNYQAFNTVFFVSTNGGYNLLLGSAYNVGSLAVDDVATNLDPDTERRTAGLPEVERDRLLTREAITWIQLHPREFGELATRKLVRAFAADTASISIVATEMSLGHVRQLPGWLIAACYFLANAAYYALATLFVWRCWHVIRHPRRRIGELLITAMIVGCIALPIAFAVGLSRYRDLFFYLMIMSVAGLLGRCARPRRAQLPSAVRSGPMGSVEHVAAAG